MRLRDGVQRPNTILQMSSSVWSYAQNGASMQCVQGRGLQGHVAFVYNFAATSAPAELTTLQNHYQLGLCKTNSWLTVTGPLNKGAELNAEIARRLSETNHHFRPDSAQRLPGRALKIAHVNDFSTLNQQQKAWPPINAMVHLMSTNHISMIGTLMQVDAENNSCQVLVRTETITLRQEDVAEVLEKDAQVMAFGLDGKHSMYNFKYGEVWGRMDLRYIVKFDFHEPNGPRYAVIERKNLQVETGLLLLKNKDYVTLQKCPMTGLFIATHMCSEMQLASIS